MARISDIGTARINDHIGNFLKGYESLTLPQLIEHFNEAVGGDPEQCKEADLLLRDLRNSSTTTTASTRRPTLVLNAWSRQFSCTACARGRRSARLKPKWKDLRASEKMSLEANDA
jgi:hypothetical protein